MNNTDTDAKQETTTNTSFLDMIREPLQEEYLQMDKDVNALTPDEQTVGFNNFVEFMQKSPDSDER